MPRILTAALLTLLCLSGMAWATTYSLMENHEKKSIELKDKDSVSVMGNQNILTVTGKGSSINVMGNRNTVEVDADLDAVNVLGNDNEVHLVKKEGRRSCRVNNTGKGNTVK